jgi:hypothetical protein
MGHINFSIKLEQKTNKKMGTNSQCKENDYNMVDINLTIIALNVNNLNTLIKRQIFK